MAVHFLLQFTDLNWETTVPMPCEVQDSSKSTKKGGQEHNEQVLVLHFNYRTLLLNEEAFETKPNTSPKTYLSQEEISTANTGRRINFIGDNAPALRCFAAVFKGNACVTKFSSFNFVTNSFTKKSIYLCTS